MNKIKSMTINEIDIETPLYIPSISSVGLKVHVNTMIKIIVNLSFPRLLISCYDLYNDEVDGNLNAFKFIEDYNKKKVLLLDSGYYESYWNKDETWDFDKYKFVIDKYDCDIYSSFDYVPNTTNYEIIYKNHEKNILNSYNENKSAVFMPIFHSFDFKKLQRLIDEFLKEYKYMIKMIAISERELGSELNQTLSNINKIRNIINNEDEDIILHILGCGHPQLMLIYTYFGADSFDSRDWAKRVNNRENLLQYPMSYLNILSRFKIS